MSSSPPDGLTVRRATVDDAPAIDGLITAADVAVQGWSESSVPELLGWWRKMDLEDLKLTVEDLERFGPTLIVDHKNANGERVLVWSQ